MRLTAPSVGTCRRYDASSKQLLLEIKNIQTPLDRDDFTFYSVMAMKCVHE